MNFPDGVVAKNSPASEGDERDVGSVPELGQSPGGGHGNPLQYSCLENPIDRGAWWATVHRVTQSQTQIKQLNTHTLISVLFYRYIDMCDKLIYINL